MIGIGKKREHERLLEQTLTSAYSLQIRIRLLDLDYNYKKDLTGAFYDGSVSVDADADVTRGLDLTLLDPNGKIHLDPNEPSSTGVYISDLISVVYAVQDPNRTMEWDIPVFCGPISGVSRDGTMLSVKAVGKESLGMTNCWRAKAFHKGQEKTYVIKQILTDLMGENKHNIPNKGASLPNDMKLTDQESPWPVAKKLAHSMGYQLFYDGRGVCQMRDRGHTKPVMKIDGKWLLGDPQPEFDLSTVINAVRVIGGKPKKAKDNVKAKAVAQRSNPLSPWQLGRTVNGNRVPRYLWMEVQDDSLRTTKECKDLANKLLAHGLLGGVAITADGIVNPRLEEMDIVRFQVEDKVVVTVPLRKFMIPLLATNAGSYGYLKPVRPRKPKHKHHHHERRR